MGAQKPVRSYVTEGNWGEKKVKRFEGGERGCRWSNVELTECGGRLKTAMEKGMVK